MPALYETTVSGFLQDEVDLIVGRLVLLIRQGITEISAEQLEAWRSQVPVLKRALNCDFARGGHLLLEFPIPRRGKRIDAVILNCDLIFVLEFKCGAKQYLREGIAQVEDYCLDLRDFHAGCRLRTIIPILIATEAKVAEEPAEPIFDFVAPVWRANGSNLDLILQRAAQRYGALGADGIDPEKWNRSEYLPTPTIVEAAQLLYAGQNVREISRCHAGAENLTKTTEAVTEAVQYAQADACKVICFVTGVPGAGKTLAGLNIIHDRHLHQGTPGAFLSGNGPLVKVLSEALARDHSHRANEPVSESRRRVSTFVQNVHRFIDAHYPSENAPPDRLIVFDEAQRAWNSDQSLRKFKRNVSEPEIMLEIMNRHQGWAVIVALIGSGQEINTGEAGLREWGRTLFRCFDNWKIFISPQLAGSTKLYGEGLFEDSECLPVVESPDLHLDVSIRSYKAQAVSDFVAYLLSFDVDAAREALRKCPGFPIVLTRDFGLAKRWLRRRQRGLRRVGLVATSGARRLRAFGLDVRSELEVENWFLNGKEDVRSSHYLETPATEFGIQGLELDWAGLCWDLDLVPGKTDWCIEAFKGTKWQKVHDATRRQYVINKYRVILTRAREGMVIWIPEGDAADRTRPLRSYDAIADYLMSCGVGICEE